MTNKIEADKYNIVNANIMLTDDQSDRFIILNNFGRENDDAMLAYKKSPNSNLICNLSAVRTVKEGTAPSAFQVSGHTIKFMISLVWKNFEF